MIILDARMSTLFERCLVIIPAAVLVLGCAQNWDECDQPSDCAAGYVCQMGRCVPASDADGGDIDVDQPDDVSPWEGADDGVRPDVPTDPAGEDDGACGSVTFPYTETQETLTVPVNVRYMHVKAWGAGGNEEHPPGYCTGIVDDGGLGGYTEAVFEVTPGTPLIVIVGGPGSASSSGTPPEERMRFGWGMDGGGGLSGVFMGPDLLTETSQDKALIIAGGGGGSDGDCANPGGTGNSEQAGGQATLQGSNGADQGVNGGGGGYHGGNGGARGQPGMGGTGFVVADGVWPSIHVIDSLMEHSEPGAGVPPHTTEEGYIAPAGSYEQKGLVFISFTCEPPQII